MSIPLENSNDKPFAVAIVGGGIGGLALVIGLTCRGISAQIYEAGAGFAEVGVGITFRPNAIQAMELIDPAIRAAFQRLATKNGSKEHEATWITFRHGLDNPSKIAQVCTTDEGKTSLSSVHRARFLDTLVGLLPASIAHFQKRLVWLAEVAGDGWGYKGIQEEKKEKAEQQH